MKYHHCYVIVSKCLTFVPKNWRCILAIPMSFQRNQLFIQLSLTTDVTDYKVKELRLKSRTIYPVTTTRNIPRPSSSQKQQLESWFQQFSRTF